MVRESEGREVEGEAGHELQLSLSGRPRDPRTQLPNIVTVEKLKPRAVDG